MQPILFQAKLIAVNKADDYLLEIAVGNAICRVLFKCAGSNAIDSRRTYLVKTYACCELAKLQKKELISIQTYLSLSCSKSNVLLKLYFKKCFKSINKETIHKVLLKHLCNVRLIIFQLTVHTPSIVIKISLLLRF